MIDKGFKVNMRNFQVNYDLSDVHKKPYGLYYLQPIDEKNGDMNWLVEDRDTITFVNDIKLLN
jgi:hypothetical protein